MTDYLLNEQAFAIFEEMTLEGRMNAIRQVIHPIFDYYAQQLATLLPERPHVHLAKHLRRTVHPPEATWVAIGGDKRGYKKYPHFQIGINEEYVFIMLALIDNPQYEREIAHSWQQQLPFFEALPEDYSIITDHTQLPYVQKREADFPQLLHRLATVKKAEFMIGRILIKSEVQSLSQEALSDWFTQTVDTLLPLYHNAMEWYTN